MSEKFREERGVISGTEIQWLAAAVSLLKMLAGNDTIIVAFFISCAGIVIIPSILGFKAIKILAGQIVPLRGEMSDIRETFSELIAEIRTQRDENHTLMLSQDSLTKTVIGLVERVTRRLSRLESNSEAKEKDV
ncbi:MAG: hypothetical protein JRC99_00145 [Deltaproteobacteria bacterium]|nr:hypothetical protein [Deltaproteobacteria bacterium]